MFMVDILICHILFILYYLYIIIYILFIVFIISTDNIDFSCSIELFYVSYQLIDKLLADSKF